MKELAIKPMKSIFAINFALWTVLGALLQPFPCRAAQDGPPVERVLLKSGAMTVVQGGASLPMTNEVSLSHGIKVLTNGVFRLSSGKERHLAEGEVLSADGMLTSPDGRLKPVFDHVAMLKGQPILTKDGEPTPLSKDTDLPDGRRVTADGYLMSASGARRKILDGETFDLTGKTVPTSDTITLKDGKVMVQKDGSLMEVPPGRTLMMNDGTKVFGEGKVVMKDGSTKQLVPEDVLKVEGVAPKKP